MCKHGLNQKKIRMERRNSEYWIIFRNRIHCSGLSQPSFSSHNPDYLPKFKPNLFVDILQWDHLNKFPPIFFKNFTASSPCTEYIAEMAFGPRELNKADPLVIKGLEVTEDLASHTGSWKTHVQEN